MKECSFSKNWIDKFERDQNGCKEDKVSETISQKIKNLSGKIRETISLTFSSFFSSFETKFNLHFLSTTTAQQERLKSHQNFSKKITQKKILRKYESCVTSPKHHKSYTNRSSRGWRVPLSCYFLLNFLNKRVISKIRNNRFLLTHL